MKKILLLMLIFSVKNLMADEINDAALTDTQALMRNSSRVNSEALSTPEAKTADRNAAITTLGNPELKQEAYNISSDLMPWLVQMTNGDPAKMMEIINEASKNPKAFYNLMPEQEKAKIKALADSIEAGRNKNKSP